MKVQLEHPPLESLSAYLDHDLSEREQADVSRHVDSCDYCRAELEALQETLTAFRGMPELEAPPGFSARVMSQIEAREQQGFWAFVRRWKLGAILTPIAVAMLVVVMVRRPEADRIEMPAVEQAREAYRAEAEREERLGKATAPEGAPREVAPEAQPGAAADAGSVAESKPASAAGSVSGSVAGSAAGNVAGSAAGAGAAAVAPEPPPAVASPAAPRMKTEADRAFGEGRGAVAPAVDSLKAQMNDKSLDQAPPRADQPGALSTTPGLRANGQAGSSSSLRNNEHAAGKDASAKPDSTGSLGYLYGSGGSAAPGRGQLGSLGTRGAGPGGGPGAGGSGETAKAPGPASSRPQEDAGEPDGSSPKQEATRRSLAKEAFSPAPASAPAEAPANASGYAAGGASAGAAAGASGAMAPSAPMPEPEAANETRKREAPSKNAFAPAPPAPTLNAPAARPAMKQKAASSAERDDEIASAEKADRAEKAYAPADEKKKSALESTSESTATASADSRAGAREAQARQALLSEPPDAIVALDDGPGRQLQVKQAALRLHGWALPPESLTGGRIRVRVFLPAGSYAKFLKDLQHRGALGATPPIPAKNVEKIWVEFNLEP